jgi:hypothetical protein
LGGEDEIDKLQQVRKIIPYTDEHKKTIKVPEISLGVAWLGLN